MSPAQHSHAPTTEESWHRASGLQSSVEGEMGLLLRRRLWTGPVPLMLEDWPSLNSLTCVATGRQSTKHQTLRRRLPRRGKMLSMDCQATCRKQLSSSASRLLRPTRYCVSVMRFSATVNWRRISTTLLHGASSSTSPSLLGIVLKVIHCACSTRRSHVLRHLYCCEQLFSKIKYTNFCLRSLLSDRHFNNILLLSSSSIEPDIDIRTSLNSWQATPAVSLTCLFCNKIIVIYILILGFSGFYSGPWAAPESLIWPSLWKGCPPLIYILYISLLVVVPSCRKSNDLFRDHHL